MDEGHCLASKYASPALYTFALFEFFGRGAWSAVNGKYGHELT
jgi:hypothetical protein